MKRLSNAERANATRANLELKRAWLANLVVKVADGESLVGMTYPTNKQEFRDFDDPLRGLRRIGSPKVLDKNLSPTRVALIDEIEGNLAKLASFKASARKRVKQPSLSSQVKRLTAERDDLKYLVGRLVSQVAMLLDATCKLSASQRATEKSKKLTSETIKALNKQVVQLGGSLMRGIKKND